MQIDAPIISIYLPCYNYGHFLEKAVESILNQDFENFELLLANDGSTDNTHELCLKYQAQDSRVVYVNNEKNLGIHQTCNKLLALARGQYITGIAADDFYLPQRLSAAYHMIQQNPELDIVFCKTILVDENANFLWTTSIRSFLHFDCMERDEFREHIRDAGTYFHLGSCIISRSLIEKHGWYEEWEVPKECKFTAEDWEANLRWTKAAKIGYVNKPLYAFRVHGSNFSSEQKMLADGGLVRAHLAVLDKHLNSETQYRLRGIQKETLMHLFGQVNMLSKQAPEIAEKVLPEIYPQLNDIKNRLEQLGQLPIPPLSEQPLVTVVIPTFNMAGCAGNPLAPSGRYIFFVLSALDSLCKQTYTNWQAVIVNDGGEDIAPLLEDFKQKYQLQQKIQYFYFNVNQGQAAARNVALEFIWQGELVTFLDDDDLYLPNHLETIVNTMRGTSLPCVYTNHVTITERCFGSVRVTLEQNQSSLPSVYTKSLLAVKNYIPLSTFALRRECILDHELRFDTRFKILEDWEFLLRLSNWYDFNYIPVQTVEIRQRQESDSVQQLRATEYAENYGKICEIYQTEDAIVCQNRQYLLSKIQYNHTRLHDKNIYKIWREKKDEYTEQNLLAALRKMEHEWEFLPHFLILVMVDAETVAHFQLTLDSLKNQYYKNYSIFVIKKGQVALAEDVVIRDVYTIDNETELTQTVQRLVQYQTSDWTYALSSGVILDSQCLLATVEQINQQAETHLVYFDEDTLYVQGANFADPQFKTDFNLDLFRAYPAYIGQCLAVRSQTLKTYRFPIFTAGWHYQLGLGIYDAFGHEAIGHVTDILVHTIHSLMTEQAQANNRQVYPAILSQHLGAYAVQAQVVEQPFSHQASRYFFDVQYAPQRGSRVTILCTAIYDVVTWMKNVLQLLAHTDYAAYEFAAMPAMFEFHQDALDFYTALIKKDARCRFIESLAEIDNPYVFYFDENVVIPAGQEAWLTRLVGCMERKDVPIDMVKPALIDAETQMPVDMFASTLAESPTLALLERQQLPQRFVHIDSLEGTLIKTALLRDPYFDLAHSHYEVIYLPTVRLVGAQNSAEPSHFRWMHDSISYNKNLSLRVPFQIETNLMVNWPQTNQTKGVQKVLQLSTVTLPFIQQLVTAGRIYHTALDLKNQVPTLQELIRFAPNVLLLTFEECQQSFHAVLRHLKKALPQTKIILVIQSFNQQKTEVDSVDYYSLRAQLRAFDYIEKVLLIDTPYNLFDPYSDVFHCESVLLSNHLLTHPEEYLDVLF